MKMNTLIKIALLFLTTLTLFACGGGSSGGGSAGGGTPNPTKIRISEATGDEGGMITFTVTASPTIAKQVTFRYEATVDNKATNPASISDLSGNLTGNGTIATNDSSTTISILTANDSLREKAETFMVMLSDLAPSDVTFTDHTAIGTILATDATGIVVIKVADAEATEDSGTIKFKVTSAFPAKAGEPFTFEYEATVDSPFKPNYSASTDDFTTRGGTATIDTSSTTISISIADDDTIEPDETFSLRLTNLSSNATLDSLDSLDSAKNSAIGTILNDDLGEISNATAIIGETEITLNWTNPDSSLFAGVTIAQTTSTDAPLNCASATNVTIIDAKNPTSDTIRGLTTGTTHSFRICARSTSGSISSGVGLASLTPTVVDQSGDGLIDIADANQLNNIRYNLAGTSYKTAAGYSAIGGCPNNACKGYELTKDIDLSSFNDGTWDPIGSNSNGNRFTAIFDGTNKTISNLRITGNNSNVGLFSTMQDATISNLKLTNISITGNGNVGALVGLTTGTNTLSNIELIGDESQSSSDAEIKGNGANVGGLAGTFLSDLNGNISDASSSLTVRGAGDTGGLVGDFSDGLIKNSNSSGSVSASGGSDNVGGLVGLQSSVSTISNSWASGAVSSNGDNNENYGGLVGLNNGAISNSWASGHISSNGSGNENYGGLVGQNSTIIGNNWASGNVSGNSNVGGLVGQNAFRSSFIRNNWASGEVTGDSNVGGLLGNNTIDFFGPVSGNINGRNYQLDDSTGTDVTNSFHLASTTDLANLSGSSGNVATTDSNWHAGFNISNPSSTDPATFDDITKYCDTNGNGMIDDGMDSRYPINEQVATNSVWVMPSDLPSTEFPAGMRNSDNVPTEPTADYYQIPAIRCIGNTPAERKANIDRQRRLFPTN